uniref:DUF6177 family protein n=1 Tax=Streptomyces flavofungini TaxID=68200 RepID=UPI0034E020DF
MTKDVIALTPGMPDLSTLLAGLFAGGPDLGIGSLAEGAVVQLCAPNGRPLVSVEAPLLVQVPGEARRLLGADAVAPEGAYWWTEARASTAVEEGERLAGSFAGRVAAVLGGTVWPPGAAHTEVVPLTSGAATATTAPEAAPPAVDVLTDKAVVVIQDRPFVAMTNWLADALRTAAAGDRALQIVTPPGGTRLTLPTRTALHGQPHAWVVQDPDCGYYDGLSGAQLRWQDGRFGPARDAEGRVRVADAFRRGAPVAAPEDAGDASEALDGLDGSLEDPGGYLGDAGGSPDGLGGCPDGLGGCPDGLGDSPEDAGGASEALGGSPEALIGSPDAPGERQLAISLRAIHTADGDLLLGRALEAAWRVLTGGPPAGWSTAEPIATTHVTHTPAGIEEHI